MPKKRWIRDKEWQRQPHVKEGPPASLWWYRRPDRDLVIAAYLDRYKQGSALPEDFRDSIGQWLDALSNLQNKKAWGRPKDFRYWDIPSYARAHDLEPPTLMKRLREMEKIAMQMFPDSVPPSRKQSASLIEKELKEIRQAYLDGTDAKELAVRFGITAAHVGRICREEKAIRAAKREEAQNKVLQADNGRPAPDNVEYPF